MQSNIPLSVEHGHWHLSHTISSFKFHFRFIFVQEMWLCSRQIGMGVGLIAHAAVAFAAARNASDVEAAMGKITELDNT